jgi:hypothetical protein
MRKTQSLVFQFSVFHKAIGKPFDLIFHLKHTYYYKLRFKA